MVLEDLKEHWRTRVLNRRGKILHRARDRSRGPQTYHFVQLALRIMESEQVDSFEKLSEQGKLRLIASYNAFLPLDFYVARGLPTRTEIFPKTMASLGSDGFADVILKHKKECELELAEYERIANQRTSEEAPARREYSKSRPPHHDIPVLNRSS